MDVLNRPRPAPAPSLNPPRSTSRRVTGTAAAYAPALLLVPIAAGVATALATEGIDGVFWCYPAVSLSYFVLPTGAAAACNAALLVLAAAMVDRSVGADAAIRLALSLGLLIVVVTMILNMRGRVQRRLAEEAITDPLTGAFNRRHMDACLRTAIERRDRSGEPASLLLFDVDHFKAINDAVGHVGGDDVLKALVAIVAGRARKVDVLFRIGGEEFALLLAGARHANALAVAEDLRAVVERAGLPGAGALSISLGVSEVRRGQSVSDWVEEADAALYRAKRWGRNRVAGSAPATTGLMRARRGEKRIGTFEPI